MNGIQAPRSNSKVWLKCRPLFVTQCAGNTLEVVINRKYLEKLQKLS